jgi:hypothetical protein
LELYREGSSLQAHFTYCRSEVLGRLCKEIALGFPQGFFSSDAFFTFGPTDIIRLNESSDGEATVELVSVERGQSRVLTQFKKSEKFGIWQDNCELNTLGQFTM